MRGDVCYLHSGPEREACAWHHILLTLRPRRGGARAVLCMLPTPQPREGGVCVVLYATYTPAPTGREGGVCVD